MCLRTVLFFLFGAIAFSAAQHLMPVITEAYAPVEGELRIGPEQSQTIAKTDSGHTWIIPAAGAMNGVVVLPDGWRVKTDTIAPGSFEQIALHERLAILRVTTGNPLDFFFSDSVTESVCRRVEKLLVEKGWSDKPLFLAGLSLAGTRALKMAIHINKYEDVFDLNLRAVAIVDAPLDMERFWYAEQRAIADDFHPAAAGEGRWVSYMLEENLGGTPLESIAAYQKYSPYSHTAEKGGNAVWLSDLPIRAYHEPDINWWIENRRKSYYQMNSLDMAALINTLKLLGNEHAELVTTHARRTGYEENASPHTWSIVDNVDLVRWFLRQ